MFLDPPDAFDPSQELNVQSILLQKDLLSDETRGLVMDKVCPMCLPVLMS